MTEIRRTKAALCFISKKLFKFLIYRICKTKVEAN